MDYTREQKEAMALEKYKRDIEDFESRMKGEGAIIDEMAAHMPGENRKQRRARMARERRKVARHGK